MAANDNGAPSERDLIASLSLLVTCLAQYFAGDGRRKLIGRLEAQAMEWQAKGDQEAERNAEFKLMADCRLTPRLQDTSLLSLFAGGAPLLLVGAFRQRYFAATTSSTRQTQRAANDH